MPPTRGFASDNSAGIHPDILTAIAAANVGHVIAYGNDPHTEAAVAHFRRHFGADAHVRFVFGGTGANVVGLKAMTEPHHAILCSRAAHIHEDECGAPEKHTGCKLLGIATSNGKLAPRDIEPYLHFVGVEHHVQPRVVSISQSTEMGTVYSVAEIRELADFAHEHGLYLHMDGARLANAAASLGASLRAITTDAGVDMLSFGGTKNGLMGAEAVVALNPKLAPNLSFIRKQATQLPSKMRFISAQFTAYLSGDLWRKNAEHANKMAQLLAREVAEVPSVRVTQPVQANGVFATIPRRAIAPLQARYFFYVWDEALPEVRWMASFDTTPEDVQAFVRALREVVLSA